MRFSSAARWMGLVLLVVIAFVAVRSCPPRGPTVGVPHTTSPATDSLVQAASQVARGRTAYLGYCAMCHGTLGSGDGPLAEELKRQGARGPALLNDRARLSTLGKRGIMEVIARGGAHTGRSNIMPAWGESLDPALIGDIADFVLVLPDVQPGPTAEVVQQFLSSPPGVPERGRELFVFFCTACHGDYGKGDGRYADTLWVRDHVRPRDLTDSSYFANVSDQRIYATLSLGGAHMGKSTFMPAWSQTIPPAEIRDLASYVRALSHTRTPSPTAAGAGR